MYQIMFAIQVFQQKFLGTFPLSNLYHMSHLFHLPLCHSHTNISCTI